MDYRPVLWALMAAAAVALLVNPWFISLFLVGAAIGIGARVRQRRRQARAAPAELPARRRTRR